MARTMPRRRARKRWTGTTAERGYDHKHRSVREQRLAQYRPGDLCAHGGEPMLWWPLAVARRYLDLPHTADRSGYLPGLACRRHNRADGQAKTAAILRARRGMAPGVWRASRQG